LEFIFLLYAFFYCPIGIGPSALSTEVVIPEITDVFVAIGKGAGAKAVMFILVLV
jgi:hypothetical protein